MHAAYKGKADMCKLLLQHGADVNCNEHEHGYTALMFAGLSGVYLFCMRLRFFYFISVVALTQHYPLSVFIASNLSNITTAQPYLQ